MQKIKVYKILRTGKNKLWWPKIVGKILTEVEFTNMPFNCFADVEISYPLEF